MKTDGRYVVSGFKISADTEIINNLFGINNDILKLLQKTFQKVQNKKSGTINELLDLIEKYPNVPQFKNQLSVLYNKLGNYEKAKELNHWIVKEHPDYLFGKINLANEYIAKKEFEKVPEILGELMDIKSLYPNRDEFHIGEVKSFYQTTIQYFVGIENLEAAESRLKMIKEIAKNYEKDSKDDIEKLEYAVSILRVKKGLENFKKMQENARKSEVISFKVVEHTKEKPTFANPIIEQLYCNSMQIDNQLVKQILELPRESLIADLHKVIYDSIARFEYFSEEIDWQPDTHEFLNHAIFLLTELKSEESLDVLLDMLRQGEEYFNFWYADDITGTLWDCILILGFNQLDKLKNYLLEPNHYTYSRTLITETVVQIPLHYPEKRNEIVQWFKEIIEDSIFRKDDDSFIDSDFIGFIVSALLDVKAIELMPLIKQLFDLDLVSEGICGDWKAVKKEMESKEIHNCKKEFYDNIYARYEYILNTWHYYNDDDDFDNEIDKDEINEKLKMFVDNHKDLDKHNSFDDYEEIRPTVPIINPNKNIGRNDPCPCGSGKKYKKCCMK